VVNCVIVLEHAKISSTDEKFLKTNGIEVVQCKAKMEPTFVLDSSSSSTTPKYDPVMLARCLLDTQATHALALQQQ